MIKKKIIMGPYLSNYCEGILVILTNLIKSCLKMNKRREINGNGNVAPANQVGGDGEKAKSLIWIKSTTKLELLFLIKF